MLCIEKLYNPISITNQFYPETVQSINDNMRCIAYDDGYQNEFTQIIRFGTLCLR